MEGFGDDLQTSTAELTELYIRGMPMLGNKPMRKFNTCIFKLELIILPQLCNNIFECYSLALMFEASAPCIVTFQVESLVAL